MEYDVEVLRLSKKFYLNYPQASHPELLVKNPRPYACLLIDCHDYFICIPYRTHISHKNAFHFKDSERSAENCSGLDYSKIAIVQEPDYIEGIPAVIDKDEYNETMKNLKKIVTDAVSYVDGYVRHVSKERILHESEYKRKYQYSTLPYFHDVLGL